VDDTSAFRASRGEDQELELVLCGKLLGAGEQAQVGRTWRWWRLGQLEVRRESGRGTPEIERAQDARAREEKAARERQSSQRELNMRIVPRYSRLMKHFIFSISTVSHTPNVGAPQNKNE